MTHRATEEAPSQKRGSPFQEKYLPHWAMGTLAAFWSFFQLKNGDAGVPGTLNQGFATMLGLWTAYVFKQINEIKDKKNG
jgi:hypothetical protein